MKHHLYLLITINFLIAASSCIAMNEPYFAKASYYAKATKDASKGKQPTIFVEITGIEDPYQALYLTKNRALINSRQQCSIIDLTTQQEIKQIPKLLGWTSHIEVHPNKKKFALSTHDSISHNAMITIYDAETGLPEWSPYYRGPSIGSSPFSPSNNTIAIPGTKDRVKDGVDVAIYDYKTNNDLTIIDITEASEHRPVISFHPTQPLMCLAWQNIYIHNLTTHITGLAEKFPLIGYDDDYYSDDYYQFCEYSSDGSFIVASKYASKNTIRILNTYSHHNEWINMEQNKSDYLCDMIIHPNSAVLLTLSTPGGILRYWDIKTTELITTMSTIPNDNLYSPNSSLSFSADGTNLMMILYRRCIIVPVPFEVIYHPITQEKGTLVYWLLKNYKDDQNISLPSDITQLLMYTLLKTCKC